MKYVYVFEFVTGMTFGSICLWFSKFLFSSGQSHVGFPESKQWIVLSKNNEDAIVFTITYMNKYITCINKLIITIWVRFARFWVEPVFHY